jgi:hypothetical protein
MRKTLAIALSGAGRGLRCRDGEGIEPMYNVSLFGIATMNASCTTNIS